MAPRLPADPKGEERHEQTKQQQGESLHLNIATTQQDQKATSSNRINGHSSSSSRRRRMMEGVGEWGRDRSAAENALHTLFDKLPLIFDGIMRALGPALVMCAWIIFAGMTYVYFVHILPSRQLSPFSYPGNLYTAVGVYILFSLMYNHIMCIFVSPGYSPEEDIPDDIEDLVFAEVSKKVPTFFSKYCKHCIAPKPERAHHCHVCKRCVLKMDHHCPWVANCVGFANYKYFFLFLLYLWIGCFYIMAMCAPVFLSNGNDIPRSLRRKHEAALLFASILAGAAWFAIGAMMMLHLYLLLTNQTTVELYYNKKRANYLKTSGQKGVANLYDMGKRRNWQSVFGISGMLGLSWLIPGLSHEIGDGIHWERADDIDV